MELSSLKSMVYVLPISELGTEVDTLIDKRMCPCEVVSYVFRDYDNNIHALDDVPMLSKCIKEWKDKLDDTFEQYRIEEVNTDHGGHVLYIVAINEKHKGESCQSSKQHTSKSS